MSGLQEALYNAEQVRPHRTAAGWTLGTVTTILQNPRCTGREVWNRQRTDTELADPGNVTLGHKSVQRWNLPDGWVISNRPAHPPLVSEVDFIAAQEVNAARGPAPQAGPVLRRYLLAGLLACGVCRRRMESAWSNSKPAYRCQHGRTSAMAPNPARPKNTYVREDQLLCSASKTYSSGSKVVRITTRGTGSRAASWRVAVPARHSSRSPPVMRPGDGALTLSDIGI